MNPHTSVNNSKNRDAFLVNQKETAAAYEWDSLDFSEKITTCESEKSRYDDGAFVKKIICKSYDPYLDDFITINTVAYDINKNGLVFTTNQPLEVGDPIFIKAKNHFKEQHNNELNEGVHAQVIWCNRTSNQQHNLRYEVGVEYFN